MIPYTVLLLYPDYLAESYGQDTYLAHVMAADPSQAIQRARAEVLDPDADNGDDFFVLLTTKGHLTDETVTASRAVTFVPGG